MSSFRRKKSTRESKPKNQESLDESKDEVFVHGCFQIEIHSAKNLPDMDSWMAKLVNKNDVTDAFIDVVIGNARLIKTRIIENSLNPVWHDSYRVEACHLGTSLTFRVRDKDYTHSEFIGSVDVSLATLMKQETVEGWFPIVKSNGVAYENAVLNLKITFTPATSDPSLQPSSLYGVKDSYFPVRNDCSVTLYQDADTSDIDTNIHDRIKSADQVIHQQRSCWKDIHDALVEAKHLICITGWGFLPQLKLLRGAKKDVDSRSLGEILIDKANKGVNVCVMIWDERSSNRVFGETGIMGNNDEATFKFFKPTKVNCVLTPRNMSVNDFTDIYNNQFSFSFYTHHQKSVVCDAGVDTNDDTRRRLVAFIGGLDLTGGRYDTPNHELFSTLLNQHDGDFRNSDVKSIPPGQGPREPWHDIHSKVEGSIAYDIFCNFKERWLKQGQKSGGKLCELDDNIIDIHWVPTENNPERGWSCQLYRSITCDSAVFYDDDDFDSLRRDSLNKKKGRDVESSIAQAYVQVIRNAQKFIYIENQYFCGSSYCWLEKSDVSCTHTIPAEITQKIVEKIHSNQRFVAYVVIPMFPNGNPSSASVQQILHYQYRTMEMMYNKVADAIQTAGSNTHPTDWLLFLCLGKREGYGEHLDQLDQPTDQMAKLLRQTLRFPIYVHSKMMIVDDVYIILGSANINERSLAGTRDTEMAVGCWQPTFTNQNPSGSVHNFRLSLWREHFRSCVDDVMNRPETLECVRKVKKVSDDNWQIYTGPIGSVTPGQILTYPISILQNGNLQNLPEHSTFPDFPEGSKIIGSMSAFIPQKLTT